MAIDGKLTWTLPENINWIFDHNIHKQNLHSQAEEKKEEKEKKTKLQT